MGDRNPFDLLEHGADGNGDIGKHKKGEGEEIEDFFTVGAFDFFPFGNGGQQSQNK